MISYLHNPLVVLALAVVAALVLFGVSALLAGFDAVARRTPLEILFRLLTGDHLDGKPRNNRTWTRPATRPLHRPVDWPMPWLSRQSRRRRAGAAWAVLLGVVLLGWGLAVAFWVTVIVAVLAAAAGAGWGVLAGLRWVARREHRRHVVRPTAAALAGHLKQHPAVTAANLKIRPRLESVQAGDPVVVFAGLPDTYAAQPTERAYVERLVGSRVPCDLEFSWQTHRHPIRLVGRCASAPPLAVPVADWLGLIDSLRPSQYFLGVSANGRPEVWDATEEDPSAMMSGKSRRGKTNVNLAVAAQALRRGERVTAIDHKRVSLLALAGVPGFTLANDPNDVDGMWAAVAGFRASMDAAIAGDWDGTPHTLILEEIPQLYRLFRDHWTRTRPAGGRMGDMPPARHIGAVLNQGAQFGHRVFAGGQDLKDELLFGYRHSFGVALLAGFTPAQWAYTIGTRPVPVPPARRGRFYLARAADTPVLLQVVVGDPAGDVRNEAAWRQVALDGRPPVPGPGGQQWRPPRRPRDVIPRLAIGWASRRELPALIQGPKQASAYLGMTQNAFAMARRRHPIPGEFQDRIRGRVTSCWSRETLDLWRAGLR